MSNRSQNFNCLIQSLNKNRIENRYLFLGPEEGLITQALAIIKNKLFGDSEKLKDKIFQYHGEDVTKMELSGFFEANFLFINKRLLIIREAESLRSEVTPALVSIIEKGFGKDLYLILISSNQDKKKINTKLEKFFNFEQKIYFWELFTNQKQTWIINFFKTNQKQITINAVNFILNMVENNTFEFKAECEKILYSLKDKTVIDEDQLENFLYHSKDESLFTLLDSVSLRDKIRSVDILHKLYLTKENSLISLIGGLFWYFRNLMKLQLLIQKGIPREKAFSQMKIVFRKMKKTYEQGLKSMTLQQINRNLIKLADLDLQLRTLSTEIKLIAFEIFLVTILN